MDSGLAQDGEKPYILFTCFPADGHLNPMLSISAHLKRNGQYHTGIMAMKDSQSKVEETGADWIELRNIYTESVMARVTKAMQMTPGAYRHAKQFQAVFLDTLLQRSEDFEKALEWISLKYPGRKIIVIDDIASLTMAPFYYGRPWPKSLERGPKSIGVGIFPLLLESQDTTPWLSGIKPDQSEEGRKRNKKLHQDSKTGSMKPYYDDWEETFKTLGVSDPSPPDMYYERYYTVFDSVLQLCSPSMEYPRSDQPSHIEFVGVLPPRAATKQFEYPSWWSDVTEAKVKGQKVIFVSQGSLQIQSDDMIVPAMKGLADVPGVLVVITLGAKGAVLPKEASEATPPNARVVDYLPYEIILPYTDVFLSNGGYGSYTQAVAHAVPLICAGETEDKPEVAMLVEWIELGMDLHTMRPSSEQVKEAVVKILGDPKYAARALELKKENETLNVMKAFERKIVELST